MPHPLDIGRRISKPDSAMHMGRISGVFGVKGWVKIFSYTDPKENILTLSPWLLCRQTDCREVCLVQGHAQGKGLVVLLPDCEDCDTAEPLVGTEIWVDRAQMMALPQDAYYWSDLQDLQVWCNEQCFGRVARLIETGANDVLVVRGGKERLIPFIQPDVIKKVDLVAGRIDVDWDPDF